MDPFIIHLKFFMLDGLRGSFWVSFSLWVFVWDPSFMLKSCRWWWWWVASRILVSAQALSHCHWAWVTEPECLSLSAWAEPELDNFKHDSPWEQISCVSSVFMVFWKGDFHVEYFSVSANYLNLQYNFGFLSCESEISTIVRARYIVTRTNSKLSFSWYDDDILQSFTEHFPIRQLDNANDKLIFNLHLLKNSSNYFQALLVLCRNLKEIFSFVKLRLRLRHSGTQALRHSDSIRLNQAQSGSIRLSQAHSDSLRLLLRLSDSGSVTGTQSLGWH